jgi:hypothetical protein
MRAILEGRAMDAGEKRIDNLLGGIWAADAANCRGMDVELEGARPRPSSHEQGRRPARWQGTVTGRSCFVEAGASVFRGTKLPTEGTEEKSGESAVRMPPLSPAQP